MKIAVCLDSDGHFRISDISNRKETIELLKSIQDGGYYDDIIRDYDLEEKGIETLSDFVWEEDFLQHFTQRGTFELFEL